MHLPILACAEKLENYFSVPHQNQNLKPMIKNIYGRVMDGKVEKRKMG